MKMTVLVPTRKEVTKNMALLPTTKTPAITSLGEASILIFGEKKIGKTSVAAQFPDVLHLFTEKGGSGQDLYSIRIRNWAHFKDVLKELKADESYKTISIDTIDQLYDMCFDWVCDEEGFEHPQERGFGAGWNAIKKEFKKYIQQLINLPEKGVIFISHSQVQERERSGRKYKKLIPTYGSQVESIVTAEVDVLIYFGYYESDRMMIIRGTETLEAGNRLKNNFWLKNKLPPWLNPQFSENSSEENQAEGIDFERVEAIPAGRDEIQAYKALVRAFKNKQEENPSINIEKKSAMEQKVPMTSKKQ